MAFCSFSRRFLLTTAKRCLVHGCVGDLMHFRPGIRASAPGALVQ